MLRRTLLPIPFAALLTLAACSDHSVNSTASSTPASSPAPTVTAQDAVATATPIKHVVVIFGENVSFDHYFATYPQAANPVGEPQFTAAAGTPAVNNLANNNLIATNPNALSTSPNTAGRTVGAVTIAGLGLPAADLLPFRLDRSQANTSSQNHAYAAEQLAYNNGAMDSFPLFTAAGSTIAGSTGAFATKGQVLGYFDGNTVTALWNYAQHFAMNQNAYTDTYGPSTPGALAVVSGQNNGVIVAGGTSGNAIPDSAGGFTMVGDLDPTGDVCTLAANSAVTGTMSSNNKNIGDLLNAKNITWGGFMGGFNLQTVNANGTTGCARSTFSQVLNATKTDYVQHHAWFQYYASTANLAHTRPSSTAVIGATDPLDNTATPVHHQYDTDDFFAAVKAGNYPSVSFLKAPAVEDGHPGNSDPIDEQAFVTKVVNFLQQQPDWKNTAVIIAYDDSDGWYDHRYKAPTSSSFDSTTAQSAGGKTVAGSDNLSAAGQCTAAGAVQPQGVNGGAVNGRCGPGTRTPFVVVSPWAKANFVDDTAITQASVVKFIEDNWLGGQRIGGGSFDATAGSIMNMFDFAGSGNNPPLYLDQNLGTKLATAPAI
ncbi:alkaline phosphatase family protein [Paraburkholderia sp. SIMBA_055]|jgi:phospholipase C|uniref:Phosphoesterase n=2 Tax=Paraburkholderia graminis TaxID=60548 RepID=B1G871_PARG4|nr:alkaline phosphatase family protein [Paraburkholderia graminis]ALE59360.1 phospholipase C [Burkholderia sp. HB1]AXF11006.1 phospholipase [Paraburkholderia graminis]EDT07666.1 phosphoesterase [Paraburkholderia graminis C4D1M]MDR6204088.1 phospholipase C [Paraburkholderia graminis]MDR6469723.1 phospholipase C [Paraburkholderia graminis]